MFLGLIIFILLKYFESASCRQNYFLNVQIGSWKYQHHRDVFLDVIPDFESPRLFHRCRQFVGSLLISHFISRRFAKNSYQIQFFAQFCFYFAVKS